MSHHHEKEKKTGDKIQNHHRKPRSRGGSDHADNISRVQAKYHSAYHLLFGNMLADEVASLLNQTYIDPDYYLVAMPRKKKKGKSRTRMFCKDCNAEVLKYLPTTTKDAESV